MKTTYLLKIHRDVEKRLQRIPKNQLKRLLDAMRYLREDPKPSGCVKLEDMLYRIRVGQYRILYAVFENEVIVVVCKIARRSEDPYKNLRSFLTRAENLLAKDE